MPSYNHAAYVSDALNSIVQQSFRDLQIIVVDDGSSDESVEIIRKNKDERIELIASSRNLGACNALNVGIAQAKGEYIAILNSDDLWHHEKLSKQLAIFESNPEIGAVFSNARFVDQRGTPIADGDLGPRAQIFNQQNRSRHQWLRRLFLSGNCLCHPSLLIRKSVYDAVGLYDNRFRQLPDLDMWIRVCKRHEIYVCGDQLVDFRLLDDEANTSGRTPVTKTRTCNEHLLIGQSFYDNLDNQDFEIAFKDLFIKRDAHAPEELEAEKAFLYFAAESPLREVYAPAGFLALYRLLGNEMSRQTLLNQYGFGDLQFHEYMSRVCLRVERP